MCPFGHVNLRQHIKELLDVIVTLYHNLKDMEENEEKYDSALFLRRIKNVTFEDDETLDNAFFESLFQKDNNIFKVI